MKINHIIILPLVLTAVFAVLLASAADSIAANPKREFRGAWIQTVFQDQWSKRSTDENKRYIRDELDKLHQTGINAVFFQVRP